MESGWEVPALRGWASPAASLAPGPHLLEPGPSSTTSYSGPCPSLTPPSPWRPFAPPLLPSPISFSLPSILKEGRTRPSFPTGDTPGLSLNLGRGPSRSLEPPLTSRVPVWGVGGGGGELGDGGRERLGDNKLASSHWSRRSSVLEHMLLGRPYPRISSQRHSD